MKTSQPRSVSAAPAADDLQALVREAIAQAGGWIPFDRYMAMALYQPGLGYYANHGRKFGWMPASGSDFVTAPELSPLFGQTLAVQLAQALAVSGTDTVYEFGPGSGALAQQLIEALAGAGLRHYTLVDLSGTLRQRQAERLTPVAERLGVQLQWASHWPEEMRGVVVANELLDAMPVRLLVRREDESGWLERGVSTDAQGQLVFADRPSADDIGFDGPVLPGMVTEIHPQAEAFVRSLAERLRHGAAFFIDYGFPEAEYYHPQRHQGTLMCHRAHVADTDPLDSPGAKDITAHVNFTGIALAGQDAGLEVLGYTSQARFLINCGIAPLLEAADLRGRAMAQKLLTEHEMGEIFKVIALGTPGLGLEPLGFVVGDRSHRL